jgi:hypothetical protein
MTMNAHSTRLSVERIEDRTVPSTVAFGDFNHDGLADKVEITAPTIVTVSLANPDGSYTVSASLTIPTKQSAQNVYVGDFNGDGNLDIATSGATGVNKSYTTRWLGNGDGTFGSPTTSDFNLVKMRWWV